MDLIELLEIKKFIRESELEKILIRKIIVEKCRTSMHISNTLKQLEKEGININGKKIYMSFYAMKFIYYEWRHFGL